MTFNQTFHQFMGHLGNWLAPASIIDYRFRKEPLNYLLLCSQPPNPQAIDEACFSWQDKNPWPWNHKLVNTSARLNILSLSQLKELKGSISAKDAQEIIRGLWLGPENSRPGVLTTVLQQILPRLATLNKIYSIQGFCGLDQVLPEQPGLQTLCDLDWCRKRGTKASPNEDLVQKIMAHTTAKHLLYGRINGSGKSQQLFALMKALYQEKIPFVAREVFYFHYHAWQQNPQSRLTRFAKYHKLEMEEGGAPTLWLLQTAEEILQKSGRKPILILDEDDSVLSQLEDWAIIAADKDISRYPRPWQIYDLVRHYSPAKEQIYATISQELKELGLSLPGQEETLLAAAENSWIPFYHTKYRTIYQAKLLLSLAALEAVKRKKEGGMLALVPADVARWQPRTHLLPAPRSNQFHCEYIIFDGRHLEWDPLTEFDPGKLIST